MKVPMYSALHSPGRRIQQKLVTMPITLARPSMGRHSFWERGRKSVTRCCGSLCHHFESGWAAEPTHHHVGGHTQQREKACARGEKARKLVRVPSPDSAEGTRVHSPHLGGLTDDSWTTFSGLRTFSHCKPGERFYCHSPNELPPAR